VAKKNYSAWHVKADDFPDSGSELDKLKFFARYAVLAPSGHNTQPWRFSGDKQTLLLGANRDRHLPYSGVQANEPMVSLGACLQTLQLAAKGFGYEVRIAYPLSSKVIAKISLNGKTAPDPSLLEAITRRSSNRHPYDTDKLPASTLKRFSDTDLEYVSTHVISGRADIEYVAEKTGEATLRTFGDKEFRKELSKWVRNNVTKRHDGMPGFTQGIPTPPSLLAKHIIKRLNISKDQAKKDIGRVRKSPNLLILSVSEETPQALLNGGRLYAQICILAQREGIATAGIGAAVIDQVSRQEIVKKYKLHGRPIAIIRIGKAKKRARHTPRWPLSQVLEDD
jgi:hypothetical protein